MKKLLLFWAGWLCCPWLFGQPKRMVVAADGTGDYRTVQAAFNAIPLNNRQAVTVFIRKGSYREKLRLDSSKNHVTLVGEDKFGTVLHYDDHTGRIVPNGDTINTYTSASFMMLADDFRAERLTFENNAGFTAGQAVAVQVAGDRAVFVNCRFTGNQDVLFTSSARSRQLYRGCYIEGTTDFIFGAATAWFESCHIHSKKNSHITAAATPKEHPFGYVFYDCMFTADTASGKVSLGRPWRPYASVAYLRCYLDRHIIPGGWDNWKNPQNEKTARYAEYKNYGPGAGTAGRVSWSRQLTDREAGRYTLQQVLGGWAGTVKSP